RVSLDALRVAGRLNTFLFAHDDLYVDVEEPSLDAVRQLNGAYEQVLATEPDAADCDVPLAAMLADIVRGLRAFNVDPEPVKQSLLAYLAESVHELERRERGLTTDLAEYLAHRPASGGVFIEFELSYLLNGFSLPRWLRDAEAFQRARQAAAIHICMANDCLSLPKELDSGDTHNVVRILRESEGRDSYQDCVSQVYDRFLLPSVREVVGNARKTGPRAPRGPARRVRRDSGADGLGGRSHLLGENL